MLTLRVPDPTKYKRWAVIYFIQGEATRHIKIGQAKDVEKRLREHQRGSPDRLSLLWCYRAPGVHEPELHRRFAEHHEHGEWFRYEGTLKAYIDLGKPGFYPRARD